MVRVRIVGTQPLFVVRTLGTNCLKAKVWGTWQYNFEPGISLEALTPGKSVSFQARALTRSPSSAPLPFAGGGFPY